MEQEQTAMAFYSTEKESASLEHAESVKTGSKDEAARSTVDEVHYSYMSIRA